MYIFEILEQQVRRKGYDPLFMDFQDLVRIGGDIIFDFDYPMYNEEHKELFEYKFFLRNYEKQIGFETIFGFKRALESKLYEILPKYNRLYELDEQKIDYFAGQMYKEIFEKESDRDGKSDTRSTVTTSETTDRKGGSETDSKTDSADMMEQCQKTSTQADGTSDGNVRTNSSGASSSDNIYKDLPENSRADSIKYASNTTHDKGKTTDKTDSAESRKYKDNSKSAQGTKRAGAAYQDSKVDSKNYEDILRDAETFNNANTIDKIKALENYTLIRENNNADGMIDRIYDYHRRIQDTDVLVLNQLDSLFSSLWVI